MKASTQEILKAETAMAAGIAFGVGTVAVVLDVDPITAGGLVLTFTAGSTFGASPTRLADALLHAGVRTRSPDADGPS